MVNHPVIAVGFFLCAAFVYGAGSLFIENLIPDSENPREISRKIAWKTGWFTLMNLIAVVGFLVLKKAFLQ